MEGAFFLSIEVPHNFHRLRLKYARYSEGKIHKFGVKYVVISLGLQPMDLAFLNNVSESEDRNILSNNLDNVLTCIMN